MAKILLQSTRIHVYGGDDCEKCAYALIGYDETYNDSCVTMIRGKKQEIPQLLRRFGRFTDADIMAIQNLNFKEIYWADNCSQIIRIA